MIKLEVNLYPKLNVYPDLDTGELLPCLSKNEQQKKISPEYAEQKQRSPRKQLSLLLNSDGSLLYPQNIYLHNLMSKRGLTNTSTHAKALLMYSRWLLGTGRNYRDITADPTEGVAWQFGDWMIDYHLRSIDADSGEVHNEDGLSISTARSYMLIIIDFYKWLNEKNILPWSELIKPFNFHTIRISDYDAANNNHMLSHIHKRKAIIVTTTDRMMQFPKVQSMASWKKLKPLTPEDEKILLKYINDNNPKSLMILVACKGGLRIIEVATLSELAIYAPVGDVCKLTLDPADGVKTKGNKKRTTEIPRELMQLLYEYKLSTGRLKMKENNSSDHHRLFIKKDGNPFNVNTLETMWSNLRKKINADLKSELAQNDNKRLSTHPLWYYRFHDLRATFATKWLRHQYKTRQAPYDFYFSELKELMGHEKATDTQKYIDFVNYFDVFSEAAARRNIEATKAMRS